jgi:hypothetical protein
MASLCLSYCATPLVFVAFCLSARSSFLFYYLVPSLRSFSFAFELPSNRSLMPSSACPVLDPFPLYTTSNWRAPARVFNCN